MGPTDATITATGDAVIDVELADFVRAHYPRLVRLAGLVCGNSRDADDAVQNGLEHAWRSRSNLRDRAALRAWLDRTVVREAIRLQRPRRLSFMYRLEGPREIALAPDVADPRIRHEADLELRLAFESLPIDQRAALVLHLYAGYSVEETAAIVGSPVETVRTRLRRGRERLRTALGDAR